MRCKFFAAVLLLPVLVALTPPSAWAALVVPPWDDPAWKSFDQGVEMLAQGAPRADVLAQWNLSLHDYPRSLYRHQLLVYTAVLSKQVAEDKRRAASAAPDSPTLPMPQRIQGDIDRLPDVRGVQFSQPGVCVALGQGAATEFSDDLVKIGWPALPALIAHLNDTRLTRSVGFWRDFAPSRTVLRVQDVAMQCIEATTRIGFLPGFNYFSDQSSGQQSKTTSEVRTWWQANKNRSPVQALIVRLNMGSVWERLDVLQQIKSMNPRAVDERVWLTRWKPLALDNEVPRLATALARYGDFTLRPRVRRLMRDPNVGPWECTAYLLRYGDVADCRYIHQQALADLAESRSLGTSRVLSDVDSALEPGDVRNPLVVPVLVDLLSYRSQSSGELWDIPGCLQTLAALTGHSETRRRGQETDWQPAATRWLAWWRAGGEAGYLAHHPDVRRVLAAS